MKNQSMNPQIKQTLEAFDNLENIAPTTAWQNALMHKLATMPLHTSRPFGSTQLTWSMVLVLALNIGFILQTLRNDVQTPPRKITLQTIAKTLLINPSSINN